VGTTVKSIILSRQHAKFNILELNGDRMQFKVMSILFALFAELERDFIALCLKEI
jgi:hypothetical protein